jgi:hypothetical protein
VFFNFILLFVCCFFFLTNCTFLLAAGLGLIHYLTRGFECTVQNRAHLPIKTSFKKMKIEIKWATEPQKKPACWCICSDVYSYDCNPALDFKVVTF